MVDYGNESNPGVIALVGEDLGGDHPKTAGGTDRSPCRGGRHLVFVEGFRGGPGRSGQIWSKDFCGRSLARMNHRVIPYAAKREIVNDHWKMWRCIESK